MDVLCWSVLIFWVKSSSCPSEDCNLNPKPWFPSASSVCCNDCLSSCCVPAGQRTLQHSGDILDTQVVLNPAHDLVCSEVRPEGPWKGSHILFHILCDGCPVCVQVRQLVCDPSRHKLLILAGQCVEDTGDIVLQKGCFSVSHFLHIFGDEEVRNVFGFLSLASPLA